MRRSSGRLAWVMVAYLLAAAAFELVLALRHTISPPGEGFVLLGALLAMAVGATPTADSPSGCSYCSEPRA